MRVFMLDDDEQRFNLIFFMAMKYGWELVWRQTADEAIEALGEENPGFDLILLDHDLGGQVYVESGPGTGQEVAEWLARNVYQPQFLHRVPQPRVVVHSWNPDGGKRMFNTLTDAGYDVDRVYFGKVLEGYFRPGDVV